MACTFIEELSKLRKLSMESVENTASFAPFKQYLHVVRPVESELRTLLRRVNRENKKCLVMLCGSAGDGKSHLMSYLRHADPEGLLHSFELYNDATESSAPELTSIDTLYEKLAPFNDENYQVDDGYKMILAINLGTLNNFIESYKGRAFTKLKQYVEDNEIFSSYTRKEVYISDSVFQHISFADYQVFTIKEDGVGTEFLSTLIGKVFCNTEENPFYQAYKNNDSCTLCQRCPVRHNYEFLSKPEHQQAVIKKIVEVVIKDKAIVSTRDILNLLYDIIVHPDFDYSDMCQCATSEVKYLTKYIQYSTPMLIYEYDDISPLLNCIRKHDVLKERQAEMDVAATRFHSLENIYEAFTEATSGTAYERLNDITKIAVLGGIKPELKKLVYRFIVRTKEFKGEYQSSTQKELLAEYIKYLYYQQSGKEKQLKKLYESTKKAIMNWDGQFDSDYICVDDSNERFWVTEQLLIQSAIYKSKAIEDDEVLRFSTNVKIRFKKSNGNDLETAEIDMDYALFEMISAMREGYRPTVQDKNKHADFVSFVQRLIEFGNKGTRIELLPKDRENEYRIIFEKNDFDYEFRVV
ncbi:MAG: DNA phosphorothioation-dependent restriction protein DptF [Blautia sp.]|nr:DNA phosphorothioation-dependent restriction protein DptF [Blautia sp.]